MKITKKEECCFQDFRILLKPQGYFMIKYWGKILLENFSINHCGMRAGKDCWLSGTELFHGSPAYPPQCWVHPGFTWCFHRSLLCFSGCKASQQWAPALCENWCMQKCPREYLSLHAAYHWVVSAVFSHANLYQNTSAVVFLSWNPFIFQQSSPGHCLPCFFCEVYPQFRVQSV